MQAGRRPQDSGKKTLVLGHWGLPLAPAPPRLPGVGERVLISKMVMRVPMQYPTW